MTALTANLQKYFFRHSSALYSYCIKESVFLFFQKMPSMPIMPTWYRFHLAFLVNGNSILPLMLSKVHLPKIFLSESSSAEKEHHRNCLWCAFKILIRIFHRLTLLLDYSKAQQNRKISYKFLPTGSPPKKCIPFCFIFRKSVQKPYFSADETLNLYVIILLFKKIHYHCIKV